MCRWACGTIFSARCIIACPFPCLVVVCHGVNNISVDAGRGVFPSPRSSFSSAELCISFSGLPMPKIFQSHTMRPWQISRTKPMSCETKIKVSFIPLRACGEECYQVMAFWTVVPDPERNVCPFHELVMTALVMISRYVAIISNSS